MTSILIVSLYRHSSKDRQNELIYCLKKNLIVGFDYIHILDEIHDENFYKDLLADKLPQTKIVIEQIKERPTFKKYFDVSCTEKYKTIKDKIFVIANSDMFFDDLYAIKYYFKNCKNRSKTCLALTRWNHFLNKSAEFFNDQHSQDCWIFGDSINFNSNHKIYLGVCACDNAIAYELFVNGYDLYNPSKTIKCYHYHECAIRDYDKTPMSGNKLSIAPIFLSETDVNINISDYHKSNTNKAFYPFLSNESLISKIADIRKTHNINSVIEINTNFGSDTLFLSDNFINVHSIEQNVDYYKTTHERVFSMHNKNNVSLYNSNPHNKSIDLIKNLNDEKLLFVIKINNAEFDIVNYIKLLNKCKYKPIIIIDNISNINKSDMLNELKNIYGENNYISSLGNIEDDDISTICIEPKLPETIMEKENYYITHSDINYVSVTEKLFETLELNSNIKIFYFTVNFEYKNKFKNVIPIPYFIDLQKSNENLKGRNILNNNESVRANMLFLKSKICRDALKLGDYNFCYVDADCLAVKDCDKIFDYVDNSISYPLLGENCHQYMMYDGKGSPFATPDGSFDINLVLEADILKELGISIHKRTPLYRQSNVLLYNKNSSNILNEWADTCYNSAVLNNWRNYAAFNDETVLNCLLWKYMFDKHLETISINIPINRESENENINLTKSFLEALNNLRDSSYLFSIFTKLPAKQDADKVRFLHGRVNENQYSILKGYLNKDCDDVLSLMSINKLRYDFNYNRKETNTLDIHIYGLHESLTVKILNTQITLSNFSNFYFEEYSMVLVFKNLLVEYTCNNIKKSFVIDNTKNYKKIYGDLNLTFDETMQLASETFIASEIFMRDCYNLPKISDTKNVLDIGANVGYFSKLLFNSGKLNKAICVEADFRLKGVSEILLKEDLNKVVFVNKAFYKNSNEKINFYKTDMSLTGNQTINPSLAIKGNCEVELVDTINLKDLSLNFDKIDLIKSDCEGAEIYLFEQENADILKHKVKKIFFESHEFISDGEFNDVQKGLMMLKNLGYECFKRFYAKTDKSIMNINYCYNKNFYSLNKIVYLVPHLSTGGMPKYLLEKIKIDLKENKDVYVIEYNFYGDAYVVQRNEISQLLKDKFIPVFQDFDKLLSILDSLKPDILHIQDEPEIFHNINKEQFQKIYDANRDYLIYETSHTSEYNPENKTLIPDKLVFCSKWSAKLYEKFDISKEISDIDFEIKPKNRDAAINLLNLDPNKKHVLQVGLFNSNKNQRYTFDLARRLKNSDICFHFVGNLAENFQNDWKDLVDNKPENCFVWNERKDVDLFLQAADLFILPSKKELNPISIKEAISFKLPCLISDIETLRLNYAEKENIYWLKNSIESDIETVNKILSLTRPKLKFGLTTAFYNVEDYIDETVKGVLDQTYDNWIWFVTDDGSTDGTKEKLIKHCKNNAKIIYVEQKFKKEMFWQPQRFVTKDCDYIITIDSDDYIMPKALEVYNHILINNPNYVAASCENSTYKETFKNENLLNCSFIDFSGLYSEKFKTRKYDQEEMWTFQKSLHHWGHLRCYKNIEGLDFGINEYNCGCNNDTLHFSYLQKFGEQLNIKRNLYKYRFRDNGISHKILRDEEWLQHNLVNQKIFALDNSKFFPVSEKYNIDYNLYNSLLLSDFNNQKERQKVSIISEKINDQNSILELYFDHDLIFNRVDPDSKYVCVNFNGNIDALQQITNYIKTIDFKEFSLYYSTDKKADAKELNRISDENIDLLKEFFNKNFGGFWYSIYYRHIYIKIVK